MDRRKFITTNVIGSVALIPGVSSSSTSRYGTPGSQSEVIAAANLERDRIKLSLSNSGIPVEVWEETSRFVLACKELYDCEDARNRFRSEPSLFLSHHGIAIDNARADSGEVRTLLAFSDDRIRTAAASGNVATLIGELHLYGYVGAPSTPSFLSERLGDLLRRDQTMLRESLAALRERLLQGNESEFGGDELAFLIQELERSQVIKVCSTAAAACVVWIAAAVHEYVAVTVGAVAALAVIVEVSVLVHQAVWVWGNEIQTKALPGGQVFGALDPEGMEDLSIAARIAVLSGNLELRDAIEDHIIGTEIEALVSAMEEIDLIQLNEDSRRLVMQALKSLSYRALTHVK